MLSECICVSRWVEYSITATLMMILLAYFVGLMLIEVIVPIAGLTFVTMCFGLLQEASLRPDNDNAWKPVYAGRYAAHLMGYVPQIFAWFALVYTFAHHISGNSIVNLQIPVDESTIRVLSSYKIPNWVIGLGVSELVFFVSFAIPNLVQTLLPPRYYIYGEYAYCTLSLISKFVLGLTVYVNVLLLEDYGRLFAEENTSCDGSSSIVYK